MRTLGERFWQKVEKTGTCWLWTGARNSAGYAVISVFGRQTYAHRLAYVMHQGEIPDGYVIDHLCNVRECVNPAHLEVVTQIENMRRRSERQTHCSRGHLRSPDNIDSSRHCRRCMKIGAYRRLAATKREAS